MPLGEPGIQVIAVSLVSLAAILGLASLVVGLISTLTAKDSLPKRVRSLMRRLPASAEDFRLRGVSLMLNGAGVMLIASLLATNLVERFHPATWTGYAPAGSVALSRDLTFLTTIGVSLAALLLFIGAYGLGSHVRYVSTRPSSSAQPGMPPA